MMPVAALYIKHRPVTSDLSWTTVLSVTGDGLRSPQSAHCANRSRFCYLFIFLCMLLLGIQWCLRVKIYYKVVKYRI